MYSLSIFNEIKMPLDWFIIYFCIEQNLFDPKIVDEYLVCKINSGNVLNDDETDLLLLDSFEKEMVLIALGQLDDLSKNFDDNILIAKDKTKFAIIYHLRKYEMDLSRLFMRINGLYADFDYPEDMENFVSYMPVDKKISENFQSHKDFELNILKNIDKFLSVKSAGYLKVEN